MTTRRRTVGMSRAACATLFVGAMTACHSAQVAAPSAPAPVLVGPVRCIGCEAESADEPDSADPEIEDAAGARTYGAYFLLAWFNRTARIPTTLSHSAATATSHVCKDEFRVEEISASAFSLFALFGWSYGTGIDTTARSDAVEEGLCAAGTWPYSGPDGLLYPDRPGPPDSPRPAPPPTPPLAAPAAPAPAAPGGGQTPQTGAGQ